jgi:hypothetical protein
VKRSSFLVEIEEEEEEEPDDAEVAACHLDANQLFDKGLINLCADCPGAPFSIESDDSLLLNSWIRKANRIITQSRGGLKHLDDRGRLAILRHGVRDLDGILCISVAWDI